MTDYDDREAFESSSKLLLEAMQLFSEMTGDPLAAAMTLRDHFAIEIIPEFIGHLDELGSKTIADATYGWADAMMEARKRAAQ
jgi:hypothetical protein